MSTINIFTMMGSYGLCFLGGWFKLYLKIILMDDGVCIHDYSVPPSNFWLFNPQNSSLLKKFTSITKKTL